MKIKKGTKKPMKNVTVVSRALTSILTKYQYTYQVSVYWYLYSVLRFPNTDTSYFKNVLEYWYWILILQYFSDTDTDTASVFFRLNTDTDTSVF
jgi:hypothetical protein